MYTYHDTYVEIGRQFLEIGSSLLSRGLWVKMRPAALAASAFTHCAILLAPGSFAEFLG